MVGVRRQLKMRMHDRNYYNYYTSPSYLYNLARTSCFTFGGGGGEL